MGGGDSSLGGPASPPSSTPLRTGRGALGQGLWIGEGPLSPPPPLLFKRPLASLHCDEGPSLQGGAKQGQATRPKCAHPLAAGKANRVAPGRSREGWRRWVNGRQLPSITVPQSGRQGGRGREWPRWPSQCPRAQLIPLLSLPPDQQGIGARR